VIHRTIEEATGLEESEEKKRGPMESTSRENLSNVFISKKKGEGKEGRR